LYKKTSLKKIYFCHFVFGASESIAISLSLSFIPHSKQKTFYRNYHVKQAKESLFCFFLPSLSLFLFFLTSLNILFKNFLKIYIFLFFKIYFDINLLKHKKLI